MNGRWIVRIFKVHASMRWQDDGAMSITAVEMRFCLRSHINERFAAFRTIERELRVWHRRVNWRYPTRLMETVPEVTPEDLGEVMKLANEWGVKSFEGMVGVCCEFAKDRDDEDLSANLSMRLMCLGRALKDPALVRWNIKADSGWHVHEAVVAAAATEPLVWKDGFDVESLSARILRLANANEQ